MLKHTRREFLKQAATVTLLGFGARGTSAAAGRLVAARSHGADHLYLARSQAETSAGIEIKTEPQRQP